MPTYDYRCQECGSVFEKFHGMNETPTVVCPSCSSANTGKQVSLGAGVVFKGSGFYVNDYKKDNKSTAPAAAKEKTSDAKPAEASKAETTATASTGHVHGPGCNHG